MIYFTIYYLKDLRQDVAILRDKSSDKYRYVNLTKGHICKCSFDSREEALLDLLNYPEIVGISNINDKACLEINDFIQKWKDGEV